MHLCGEWLKVRSEHQHFSQQSSMQLLVVWDKSLETPAAHGSSVLALAFDLSCPSQGGDGILDNLFYKAWDLKSKFLN